MYTKKITLVLALAVISYASFAQRFASKTKGELVGIHLSFSDFEAAKDLNSFSDLTKQSLKDMAPGLAISYWKGLTPYVDFSTRLNAIFHDYASAYSSTIVNNEVGIELEPSLYFRPVSDAHLFAPFLSAGIGAGFYTKKLGAYVPLGLGLQTNLNSIAYVFLQAQYKATLTKNVLGNNLYYSLGVAGNVGKEKEIKEISLPIIPVKSDRDNDGVEDALDECPDLAGLVSMKGCPDTDGDGITDAADKCPSLKGLAKYNGCPVPDTDGDGINDELDKCPDVKGLAKYNGCPVPDTDKDGVNDEDDKCPNLAGTVSNFGCPEIKKEVINRVNMAAKNIFFASGSSRLLAKSYSSLDNVVSILKENPSYKVSIDGYTDNTGSADKNQILSEARANAVQQYLIGKGIEESRLKATGHGPNNPVADNKTAAGRAQNRRVELTLSNY